MVRFLAVSLCIGILIGCSTVAPRKSPDVLSIAKEQNYALAPVSQHEQSLLASALTGTMRSIVLMQEDDRMAAMWWIDRAEFTAVKNQVFRLLSPKEHDIVDEALPGPDGYTIDVLAFSDDELLDERILIARIGNMLLEFHFREEFEANVMEFLWALASHGGDRE